MKKSVYGFVIAVLVLAAGCDQVMDAITTLGDEPPGTGFSLAGVSLISVVADGQASDFEPTTTVTLTFDTEVEGLAEEHITFQATGENASFVNGVAKGTLVSKGNGVYELPTDALLSVGPHDEAVFTVTVSDGEIALSPSDTETVAMYAWVEMADATALAAIGDDADTLSYWYKQTDDITISNTWTPIGSAEATPFTGVYDGGNKVIFPNAVTSTEHFGVFGYADGATFKNIHIGTKQNPGSMTASGQKSIGGIAFWTENTAFTNCSNAATLTVAMHAGGICAQFRGEGSMNNCWNTGTINSDYDAGGIVGYIANSNNNLAIEIKNCYNKGTINANRNAGGIASNCSSPGEITACYNEGAITVAVLAPGNTTFYADGIVGSITGDYEVEGRMYITACYNRGNVSSSATQTEQTKFKIGGITGWNEDGWVTITASYNTGAVSYTGNGSGGAVYIGGISGHSTYYEEDDIPVAPIYACYWAGGATNGIGAKEAENEEESPSPSDCGTYQFASVWPSTGGDSGHEAWGTGKKDGSGVGHYCKSLGSSPSTYPKLWFEDE